MDVLFYLKEHLKSHKTISIVVICNLYKSKTPGKYDEQKRSFVPPSYALSFNREITDPEELAMYIAKEENIALDAAKLQINEFVEQINRQLTYGQQVSLEGLGKFIFVDHAITFLPDQDTFLANEFYGFPNLNDLTATIKEKTANTELEFNSSDVKETNTLESANELQAISPEHNLKYTGKPFTPNYDYDDDSESEMSKPVKILLRILLIIAIIAAIVGLAYFFNPKFFDSFSRTNSEISDAQPIITNDSLDKADYKLNIDTTKANLDSSVAATAQPKTTTILPLPIPIDSTVTRYEVIGSAERSQKRIDLVINRMKKRGIDARALENVPGRLIKISLGSFTNLALAKNYKDSLRKKLNNPDIYIQTINPKK